MGHVRRPLLGLVVLYAGAVAVDRAGHPGIAWWVFALAAGLVAVAFVRSHSVRRTPSTVLSALAPYLLLKTLLPAGPGSVAFDVYIGITEATFVVMVAALAGRLASAVQSLDAALGSVAFGENPALPLEAPQAGNEILAEMARSRRHERPLSVTVLAPNAESFDLAVDRSAEEVQRAIHSRYVRGKLSRLIADQLRRSDMLFEDARTGHYLVLSPETGDDGAALLVGRIRAATAAAGLRLETGSASFPDHAVSFEQLVELAERRMSGDVTVPPRLRAITGAPGSIR